MNSVFMKKKDIYYKICYDSILQTIPKGSYTEPQKDNDDKIEMRWRFLHIPNIKSKGYKKVVEISKCHPNESRKYLDNQMKWVNMTVDPYYDQFVIKQYYYYTEE